MNLFDSIRTETVTQKPKCFSNTTQPLILSVALAVILGIGAFLAAYLILKWPLQSTAFIATGAALGTLCVTYSAFRCLCLSPAPVENQVPISNSQENEEVPPPKPPIPPVKHNSSLENKNLELKAHTAPQMCQTAIETKKVSNRSLEPKQFLFKECTQYEYPVKNRQDAIDCSIMAAYAILYLKENYDHVLGAVRCENLDAIVNFQQEILTKGYELTHPNGTKASVLENAIRVEEIHANGHFGIFKTLNLPEPQEVWFLENVSGSFKELKEKTTQIVKKFFDSTEGDSKDLHYLIATIDGQTFTFFGIKGSKFAFLFDSHRNEFNVVNLEKALDFIFLVKLNGGTNMAELNFEFYPGFIKS